MKNYSESTKIDVLLATYNGEHYLQEFLSSLEQQVGVRITLHVSDDGSTDQTLMVLEQYRDKFEEFYFYQNNGLGAKKNFFFLLAKSSLDYIAFADQDDIWMPKHLEDSISRLEQFKNLPAGTFTDVIEFSKKNVLGRRWPNLSGSSGNAFLFENHARGCTLVINSQARKVLNYSDSAIMHDWWIALVLEYTGLLIYSPEPEILYRLHENNLIGGHKNIFVRARRFFKSRKNEKWLPLTQLLAFAHLYSDKVVSEKARSFRRIENLIAKPAFFRKLGLAFNPQRYRSSLIDEFGLRVIIILRG